MWCSRQLTNFWMLAIVRLWEALRFAESAGPKPSRRNKLRISMTHDCFNYSPELLLLPVSAKETLTSHSLHCRWEKWVSKGAVRGCGCWLAYEENRLGTRSSYSSSVEGRGWEVEEKRRTEYSVSVPLEDSLCRSTLLETFSYNPSAGLPDGLPLRALWSTRM